MNSKNNPQKSYKFKENHSQGINNFEEKTLTKHM